MNQIFNLISSGTPVQAIFALLGLVLLVFMAATIALFFISFWVLAFKGLKDSKRLKKGGNKTEVPEFKKFKLN